MQIREKIYVFRGVEKWEPSRSQNATLKSNGRGQHRKYTPKAFSEQGVYMLEESFENLKEMVSEIGPPKRWKLLGFLELKGKYFESHTRN